MGKYKIWYQTSTVIDNLPGYTNAIMEQINKVKDDDFDVIPHGVQKGTLDQGYAYIEYLNNAQIIENLIQAEKEGYDAVVYGCFADPMMTEAREILNIPVIGCCQTAMLWSQIYGAKAAIVTNDSVPKDKGFRANTIKYGMEHYMIPIISFDASITSGLTDPKFLEEFDKACHKAVELGAEVILPGCGLLNLAAQKAGYTRVGNTGALVLDAIGCAIKTAEAAVILKEKSGMMTSRSGLYASPSTEVLARDRMLFLGK